MVANASAKPSMLDLTKVALNFTPQTLHGNVGHVYGSSFRRLYMVMRNMCTLVALAVGLRMHFTSVAFAAALTSSSPCTGPAHALHVCKFISLHYAYECSPCMQVHLLGPCLRTQFVLLCNWEDATAVTEKIKFLRNEQPLGPREAQRISIRTKCENTRQ